MLRGSLVQEKLASRRSPPCRSELLAEPLTERHVFWEQMLTVTHFFQPQHIGATLSHRAFDSITCLMRNKQSLATLA